MFKVCTTASRPAKRRSTKSSRGCGIHDPRSARVTPGPKNIEIKSLSGRDKAATLPRDTVPAAVWRDTAAIVVVVSTMIVVVVAAVVVAAVVVVVAVVGRR